MKHNLFTYIMIVDKLTIITLLSPNIIKLRKDGINKMFILTNSIDEVCYYMK